MTTWREPISHCLLKYFWQRAHCTVRLHAQWKRLSHVMSYAVSTDSLVRERIKTALPTLYCGQLRPLVYAFPSVSVRTRLSKLSDVELVRTSTNLQRNVHRSCLVRHNLVSVRQLIASEGDMEIAETTECLNPRLRHQT